MRSKEQIVTSTLRRRLYAAASFFFLLLSLVGAHPGKTEEIERRLGAMGTTLTIQVEAAGRAEALAASETAVQAIESAERRLSTWTPHSELANLNAAPAATHFATSTTLASELSAAQQCAAATGGAFDPTIGRLVEAWDLRGEGRTPDAAELAQTLAHTGHEKFTVGTTGITKKADVQFEEGAFGKGAGLKAALSALSVHAVTSAVINLGGQFASTREWDVSIAHPQNRSVAVLRLRLPTGSFATSGNSEKGKHILDSRTGHPARDFGSVGVWSPNPLRADCLSTGLFVMGPEGAIDWASSRPNAGVVIIEPAADGAGVTVRLSRRLKNRIIWKAATTEIIN